MTSTGTEEQRLISAVEVIRLRNAITELQVRTAELSAACDAVDADGWGYGAAEITGVVSRASNQLRALMAQAAVFQG